jgi:hypothetical protein
MRKDLHKKLGLRIRVERQAMKNLVKPTQHGLEAKTVEVTDNFLQGLKTIRCEFKTS